MKFGRRLQEQAYEPYRAHYIAYKELKKAIKLITGSDTSSCTISDVTTNFGNISAFTGPANRSTLKQLQSNSVTSIEALEQLFTEAESAADGVAYLYAFVKLNFIGFRKITKKYDKHSKSASSGWYLARLVKEKFVNLNFDYLVELIAACFTALRNTRFMKKESSKKVISEVVNNYVHTTYLVSEENIMEVRVHLAKHLPLIAIGTVHCPEHSENVVKELSQGIPHRHRKTSLLNTQESEIPTDDVVLTDLKIEEPTGTIGSPSIYKYEQQKSRVSHGCLYFDKIEDLSIYRKVLNGVSSNVKQECLRARWDIDSHNVIVEIINSQSPAASIHEKFDIPIFNDSAALEQNDSAAALKQNDSAAALKQNDSAALEQNDTAVLEQNDSVAALKQNDSAALENNRGLIMSQEDFASILNKKGGTTIDDWLIAQPESRQNKLKYMIKKVKEPLETQNPFWQCWLYRTIYRDNEIHAYLDEGIRFSIIENQINDLYNMPDTISFGDGTSRTMHRSPVGILAVSIPFGPRPEFLSKLAGMTSVTEVWGYSIFLHGTAVLKRQNLNLRELPHWFKCVQVSDEEIQNRKQNPDASPAEAETAVRVDIMTNKPRDRLMHDHAVSTQQEERLIVNESSQQVPQSSPATFEKNNALNTTLRGFNESNARTPLLQGLNSSSPIRRPPSRSILSQCSATISNLIPRSFCLPNWLSLEAPIDNNSARAATVRVEPKTFFANERTLLQWMNTAVLLSTISITLLNFGTASGRLAGLILSPVALFFIIYAFMVYLRRSYSLERKEPINYNDRLGPAILVICLIGALSAIIILNIATNRADSKLGQNAIIESHKQVIAPVKSELLNNDIETSNGFSIGNNLNNSDIRFLTPALL